MHCSDCGCVIHWESLRGGANRRIAVNARNFAPDALGDVRVGHFDGATTWVYLD